VSRPVAVSPMSRVLCGCLLFAALALVRFCWLDPAGDLELVRRCPFTLCDSTLQSHLRRRRGASHASRRPDVNQLPPSSGVSTGARALGWAIRRSTSVNWPMRPNNLGGVQVGCGYIRSVRSGLNGRAHWTVVRPWVTILGPDAAWRTPLQPSFHRARGSFGQPRPRWRRRG